MTNAINNPGFAIATGTVLGPGAPGTPLPPGTWPVVGGPGGVNGTVTVTGDTAPAAPVAPHTPAPPVDTNATPPTEHAATVPLPSEPTSEPHGSGPAVGRAFHSVGDPHEQTGDGLNFDNMKEGVFIKARAKDGSFELQTRQDRAGNVTYNGAAAVKLGRDVVAYDAKTKALTVNGEAKTLTPGQSVDLPDGGKLTANGQSFDLTSPKGDKVKIVDNGAYLDVSGEVSEKRQDGEVQGSLGSFDADADAADDLVGQDGKQYTKDKADDFIETWRAGGDDNLFDRPAEQAEPKGGRGPGNEEGGTDLGERLEQLNDLLEDLGPEGLEHLTRLVDLLKGEAAPEAPVEGDDAAAIAAPAVPAGDPAAAAPALPDGAPAIPEAPAGGGKPVDPAAAPAEVPEHLGDLNKMLAELGPEGWQRLMELMDFLRQLKKTEAA